MPTLHDLLENERDDRVIVAAFPLEDQTKSLEDIFPKSWLNQEGEPVVIPLLLAPPQVVREMCAHMFNAGEEFLKNFYDERTPDLPGYSE
jgi:hypothetical protein